MMKIVNFSDDNIFNRISITCYKNGIILGDSSSKLSVCIEMKFSQ